MQKVLKETRAALQTKTKVLKSLLPQDEVRLVMDRYKELSKGVDASVADDEEEKIVERVKNLEKLVNFWSKRIKSVEAEQGPQVFGSLQRRPSALLATSTEEPNLDRHSYRSRSAISGIKVSKHHTVAGFRLQDRQDAVREHRGSEGLQGLNDHMGIVVQPGMEIQPAFHYAHEHDAFHGAKVLHQGHNHFLSHGSHSARDQKEFGMPLGGPHQWQGFDLQHALQSQGYIPQSRKSDADEHADFVRNGRKATVRRRSFQVPPDWQQGFGALDQPVEEGSQSAGFQIGKRGGKHMLGSTVRIAHHEDQKENEHFVRDLLHATHIHERFDSNIGRFTAVLNHDERKALLCHLKLLYAQPEATHRSQLRSLIRGQVHLQSPLRGIQARADGHRVISIVGIIARRILALVDSQREKLQGAKDQTVHEMMRVHMQEISGLDLGLEQHEHDHHGLAMQRERGRKLKSGKKRDASKAAVRGILFSTPLDNEPEEKSHPVPSAMPKFRNFLFKRKGDGRIHGNAQVYKSQSPTQMPQQKAASPTADPPPRTFLRRLSHEELKPILLQMRASLASDEWCPPPEVSKVIAARRHADMEVAAASSNGFVNKSQTQMLLENLQHAGHVHFEQPNSAEDAGAASKSPHFSEESDGAGGEELTQGELLMARQAQGTGPQVDVRTVAAAWKRGGRQRRRSTTGDGQVIKPRLPRRVQRLKKHSTAQASSRLHHFDFIWDMPEADSTEQEKAESASSAECAPSSPGSARPVARGLRAEKAATVQTLDMQIGVEAEQVPKTMKGVAKMLKEGPLQTLFRSRSNPLARSKDDIGVTGLGVGGPRNSDADAPRQATSDAKRRLTMKMPLSPRSQKVLNSLQQDYKRGNGHREAASAAALQLVSEVVEQRGTGRPQGAIVRNRPCLSQPSPTPRSPKSGNSSRAPSKGRPPKKAVTEPALGVGKTEREQPVSRSATQDLTPAPTGNEVTRENDTPTSSKGQPAPGNESGSSELNLSRGSLCPTPRKSKAIGAGTIREDLGIDTEGLELVVAAPGAGNASTKVSSLPAASSGSARTASPRVAGPLRPSVSLGQTASPGSPRTGRSPRWSSLGQGDAPAVRRLIPDVDETLAVDTRTSVIPEEAAAPGSPSCAAEPPAEPSARAQPQAEPSVARASLFKRMSAFRQLTLAERQDGFRLGQDPPEEPGPSAAGQQPETSQDAEGRSDRAGVAKQDEAADAGRAEASVVELVPGPPEPSPAEPLDPLDRLAAVASKMANRHENPGKREVQRVQPEVLARLHEELAAKPPVPHPPPPPPPPPPAPKTTEELSSMPLDEIQSHLKATLMLFNRRSAQPPAAPRPKLLPVTLPKLDESRGATPADALAVRSSVLDAFKKKPMDLKVRFAPSDAWAPVIPQACKPSSNMSWTPRSVASASASVASATPRSFVPEGSAPGPERPGPEQPAPAPAPALEAKASEAVGSKALEVDGAKAPKSVGGKAPEAAGAKAPEAAAPAAHAEGGAKLGRTGKGRARDLYLNEFSADLLEEMLSSRPGTSTTKAGAIIDSDVLTKAASKLHTKRDSEDTAALRAWSAEREREAERWRQRLCGGGKTRRGTHHMTLS